MPFFLPDLRQLRALVAIADEGSFSSAARKLQLTQSAVSHSMRGLEESLGCKLLTRAGRYAVPTHEGRVILERGRRAFQELKKVERELDGLRVWGQKQIHVGAPHSLFEFLLPSVIREFQDYFPQCEPLVQAGGSAELLKRLGEGELDLALALEQAEAGGANFQPLFRDHLVFVVAPGHPWSVSDAPEPGAMAEMQYVTYARTIETRGMIEDYFRSLGVDLRHPLTMSETGALLELVRIELGVGIVAAWVARRELEEGKLVEVKLPGASIERQWGFFTPVDRKCSPVEEVFIELATFAARLLAMP